MCQLSQHIHYLGGFAELKVLIVLICVQAVSTASCERTFSALKIIKTRLRSTTGDAWLDGLLLAYSERDLILSGGNGEKHGGLDPVLDMFRDTYEDEGRQ